MQIDFKKIINKNALYVDMVHFFAAIIICSIIKKAKDKGEL